MSRVQLALNVDDLDASIAFYTKLFQTPPAKVRPDYANFAIADPPLKLVLFANSGEPGTLNHIGVEVETTDEVAAVIARTQELGFDQHVQENVSCCFAVQDKTWVKGPENDWEFYTVLADAPAMSCGTDDACCPPTPEPCVTEPAVERPRRFVAEALGTGLLIVAVIGSGIMAERLSPSDVGLQLLENAAATGAALVALILIFGSVSGAHFNPAVTLVARVHGTITTADAGVHVVAQVLGGCAGAILANLMFDLPADRTLHAGPILGCSVAVRSRRHSRTAARDLWLPAHRSRQRRALRGRALDRRRVLVHILDQLRQPGRHDRPHALGQLRRNQTLLGADVHRHATDRHRHRPRTDQRALPDNRPRRSIMSERPEVLFVCVHNAGRSQMAAALLMHYAGDSVVVRSAGTAPADTINPTVVTAMREVGIDLNANQAVPKLLTDETVEASDIVITMGCGDACPYYPGKRYEDWKLDDPAGQPLDVVRTIRDEIDSRVRALLDQLHS